jgi:hypothetical protein
MHGIPFEHLTRNSRVELPNYQTRKLSSDMAIPLLVKHQFGRFYRALFDPQVQQDRMQSVFLEYAWDMGWCAPCAADPLSVQELRELGMFWQSEAAPASFKRQAREVNWLGTQHDPRKNGRERTILHGPGTDKTEGVPKTVETGTSPHHNGGQDLLL